MREFAEQIFIGALIELVSLILSYRFKYKPFYALVIFAIGTIGAGLVAFGGPNLGMLGLNLSPVSDSSNLELPKCSLNPAPTLYVTETPLPTDTPFPTQLPGSLRPAEVGTPLPFVARNGCFDEWYLEESSQFTQPTSDEMQSLSLLQTSESCVQTEPSSVTHRISVPINSKRLWRFQSCSSNDILASDVTFLRSGKYGFCDITKNFLSQEYLVGGNHCKIWTTKLTLTKDIVLLVQYDLIRDSHEAGVDLWFSPGIYEQKFLISVK